jgi:hypothetical protein
LGIQRPKIRLEREDNLEVKARMHGRYNRRKYTHDLRDIGYKYVVVGESDTGHCAYNSTSFDLLQQILNLSSSNSKLRRKERRRGERPGYRKQVNVHYQNIILLLNQSHAFFFWAQAEINDIFHIQICKQGRRIILRGFFKLELITGMEKDNQQLII